MAEAMTEWVTLAGLVGIIAFLWRTSSDFRKEIGGLRERMAILEGFFEGLPNAKISFVHYFRP